PLADQMKGTVERTSGLLTSSQQSPLSLSPPLSHPSIIRAYELYTVRTNHPLPPEHDPQNLGQASGRPPSLLSRLPTSIFILSDRYRFAGRAHTLPENHKSDGIPAKTEETLLPEYPYCVLYSAQTEDPTELLDN
ncbi:hypothetical protein C0995_011180, partial [Termitomyces sp. Mi166